MKKIEMDVPQRISLGGWLTQFRGGIMEAITLSKVVAKVALTEEEAKTFGVETLDNGMIKWSRSANKALPFDLEDAEGDTLLAFLRSFNGYTTQDAIWSKAIMDQLQTK